MSELRSLIDHIERRSAVVAVVGMGYVGVPLAVRALEVGYTVIAIEADRERAAALSEGRSYIEDVDDSVLKEAVKAGRLRITGDHSAVAEADVVSICVPTPLVAGVPDLSFVTAAAEGVAPNLKVGALVALESTTYPGTTEEVVAPILAGNARTVGKDLFVVFSPERIDPGNVSYPVADIPKVLGGVTEACADAGEAFYSTIVTKVVRVRSPREAEMAKLLENTYRQVNIALANEFAMVAHELDIDIWEVIDAASTKPFGFQAFRPGIGIGGHCIAVDPVYLTWRIRELGRAPFRLVELAREVDDAMPRYVARRIVEALGRPADGARVLALGVTYKPDVADVRESRAPQVLTELAQAGVEVSFHDPFVTDIQLGTDSLSRTSLDLIDEVDLVAILTHHSSYDWNDVVGRAARVFDARGVTQGLDDPKIVRL